MKKTVKINQVKGRMAPGKSGRKSDTILSGDTTKNWPSMSTGHKWDHGIGPEWNTRMGKSLARTGKSQSPKSTYLAKNGVATGTANK